MKGRKSNSKNLMILTSLAAAVAFGSIAAGTTYALFTSQVENNVTVSSGKVKVTSALSDLALYSPTSISTTEGNAVIDSSNAATTSAFANGGTASIQDGTLTLTNMTPGDKVTFKLTITNESTVNIKYRTAMKKGATSDDTLFKALEMNIGGLSSEYVSVWKALAAPATEEEKTLATYNCTVELPTTVSGDAYMDKSCSLDFSVEAVQGNAATTDDENATTIVEKEVAATGDTTLTDANSTITATLPAGSVTAEKVSLIRSAIDAPGNITIDTGAAAISTEVKIVDENGEKVKAAEGQYFTVTLKLEKYLSVLNFYHNGDALTAVSKLSGLTGEGMYYYDASTGKMTYTTAEFSTFTAVVDYGGGNGTEANPYLVSTEDQAINAYKKTSSGGYFKLVKDVNVTNEVYLSGKTFVWDLNGHAIQLDYSEDAKPNNGGVFNISGKNGKLTINDSSEAQTGKVIGSDKTYSNKVTSAVRVGNYGKLIINGGHFIGRSEGTSCIFAYTAYSSGSKCVVTINGGKFETLSASNGTYYVLNHQDSMTAGCTMTVNGGSFKNYNPGITAVDPENAYTGKIALGTGYETKESTDSDGNTWYTVVKAEA